MFSSADLIEAVRRRARVTLRPQRPAGEFPPGWQSWLAAMGERIGKVTGATADAILEIFLLREPAPRPPRMGELNRWQAFATLWRQQWQPPAPEERQVRLVAAVLTFLIHIVLLVILLWIAYVRFAGAPPPTPGEEVVQVEYVGEGTPQEQGGGAPSATTRPPAAAPATAPSPQPRPRPVPPSQPAPGAAAPPPAAAARQEPQPQPPAVELPNAQPLQVTEVGRPDTEFVLPPPVARQVEIPQATVTTPELRLPSHEVQMVERAQLPTAAPQLATGQLAAPQLEPEVAQEPLPQVQARQAEIAPMTSPQPQLREQAREVPLNAPPAPAPAPVASAPPAPAAPTPTPGNAPAGPATQPGGTPATRSGGGPAAASAQGAGPMPAAKPGSVPSPQRGDEWGLSRQNRPGGQPGGAPGLFNAEGRPRLGPGTEPGTGTPPGTVEEKIANLDRAGTWLKRPPIDYTPTRFDKLWTPSESLLEEWVRRNIRSVFIPIPGTTKRLHCVVSLLQLGGGCGIDDPNMQDQEAGERPPPDVPFKPKLQQDQNSLRPPGG